MSQTRHWSWNYDGNNRLTKQLLGNQVSIKNYVELLKDGIYLNQVRSSATRLNDVLYFMDDISIKDVPQNIIDFAKTLGKEFVLLLIGTTMGNRISIEVLYLPNADLRKIFHKLIKEKNKNIADYLKTDQNINRYPIINLGISHIKLAGKERNALPKIKNLVEQAPQILVEAKRGGYPSADQWKKFRIASLKPLKIEHPRTFIIKVLQDESDDNNLSGQCSICKLMINSPEHLIREHGFRKNQDTIEYVKKS